MLDVADPDILVAFKKSRWEHFAGGEDGTVDDRVDADSVQKLQNSHQVHREGVDAVVDHLRTLGFDPTVGYRGDIADTAPYDLVIPIGGDGTVLDISHKVEDVPILAVNSHPESSVGYFCAGPAREFPKLFADARSGELPAHDLLRFRVHVDGEPTGPPVLNEILFAHTNPAAVSRYVLAPGAGEPEEHRSSGVWIATPAGTTAAIRSAGGEVLPLSSDSIEYVVREPYALPHVQQRYVQGIQPLNRPFRLRSRMQDAAIFVDGPHICRDLGFDQLVTIGSDAPDLTVVGLDADRRTAYR